MQNEEEGTLGLNTNDVLIVQILDGTIKKNVKMSMLSQ